MAVLASLFWLGHPHGVSLQTIPPPSMQRRAIVATTDGRPTQLLAMKHSLSLHPCAARVATTPCRCCGLSVNLRFQELQ